MIDIFVMPTYIRYTHIFVCNGANTQVKSLVQICVARICANSTGLQFRPGEMFCNAILHDKQTWPRLEMYQGTGNVVITDRG